MTTLPKAPLQSMCLQHRITQHLFRNRLPPPHVGVVQFASQLRRLYEAIEAKDPYAVLMCDQVRETLSQARDLLQRWESGYAKALTDCRGLTVHQPLTTKHAKTFTLHFMTPEAYQASFMLIDMDYLLSVYERCRQFGIVLPDSHPKKLRYTAMQVVKKTLQWPFAWQSTGMTDASLIADNQQSQTVAQQMDVILSRPMPIQTMGWIENNTTES